MNQTRITDVIFPVITKRNVTEMLPHYLGLWGTAFYIGGCFFMTAKHVLQAATTSVDSGHATEMAIGRIEDRDEGQGVWTFLPFIEYELDDKYDIGVFKVNAGLNEIVALEWETSSVNVFDDVKCAGFPYSLDLHNQVINFRGTKGHVIGTGMQNEGSTRYRSYELSFSTPRGLSGTFLFQSLQKPKILGIIIGNRSHEMEVNSIKEIIDNGQRIETYTRIEVMHIGLAIRSEEILRRQFAILGGTMFEHLQKNQLIA